MPNRPSTNYLHAAETVLAEAREPMTADALTAEAIRRGLIQPHGKTPIATMSARLYVEVRENPEARTVRVDDPGPTRARRGSVRWALRGARG